LKGYDQEDENNNKELVEKAFNQLTAYIYLENSDRSKYGSLLADLQTQQSLKSNQYPQNLVEANNVLSSHRFRQCKKEWM
jgi:hypothetical protein